MRSISRNNPGMSVVESVLGKSLVPLRRKLTESKKGQRILCLDGGGIKVRYLGGQEFKGHF